MSKNQFLARLHFELLRRGCPGFATHRILRETAGHFADLVQSASAQGLSSIDAETRAAAELGDPAVLAAQHLQVRQKAFWCGRHPVLGFLVFPLILIPVFYMLLCLGTGLGIGLVYYGNFTVIADLRHDPAEFQFMSLFVQPIGILVNLLISIFLIRHVRRCALPFKWVIGVSVICLIHAVCDYIGIDPKYWTMGLGLPLHLTSQCLNGLVPLLVVLVTYAWSQRQLRLCEQAA
jgi:hypothetical protein